MTDLLPALESAMIRDTGTTGKVENLTRLSGGANMESTSFDFGGAGYVLRRAPSEAFMVGRSISLATEANVIRAARAAGVLAPEVVAELQPQDGLGTGYVMRRVEAEVNPAKILADPPARLIHDLARELARTHSIVPRDDLGVPHFETTAAIEVLAERFEIYGGDRPIVALAIKWCRDHIPAPVPPVLVHGDFRMGNVMVDREGLAAVLDWELIHWGDPHEDLAYGCLNVWRFGHIDRPAFGCADLDTCFAAYEAAGGINVDRARFRFWLVFRTLWWALGCLQMAETWRSGGDRTLERPVIGRRTSENEMDLLLLLEEEAPETQRLAIRHEPAPGARRQGEPSATELLEAIRDWIDTDVKSKAQGREKFMAAVAMNALGMLIRETENPVEVYDRVLADDILAGRKTLASPGLLARLRRTALAKLANDSPKYSALHRARTLWGG